MGFFLAVYVESSSQSHIKKVQKLWATVQDLQQDHQSSENALMKKNRPDWSLKTEMSDDDAVRIHSSLQDADIKSLITPV